MTKRKKKKPILLYNMKTGETRIFPTQKQAAASIGSSIGWISDQVNCRTETLYHGWTVIDLDEGEE